MKKTVILLAIILPLITYAQTSHPISIKGDIDGIKEGTLHLIVQQSNNKTDTLASAPFKKSRFEIKAQLTEPLVTYLMIEGYQGGFMLLAEPGVKYKAHLANNSSAYIKGGALNDAYTAHMKKSDSLRNIVHTLQQRYDTARKEGKFRSASQVNDSLSHERTMWQKMTSDFLGSHDDLITAYTLYSNIMMREMNLNETKRIYESMGEGAKATHCGRLIKERIEQLEETANNAPAPDFTADDLNGNKVTMSKIEGKIKIIDFWASWCGPCRLNNPALKKLYEDFHDKGLEIIGVSLDNNADKWKNAVKKDGLTWINLSTLKGWNCEIARKYNVSAIPALFVLNEENRIIATGLRGEALRTFIEERLK